MLGGKPLEMVVGHTHLGQKKGTYLVLASDQCTASDMQALSDCLQSMEIEAVIVPESLITGIRSLSGVALSDLKNAIEAVQAGRTEMPIAEVTPERVVAALRKQPDLLAGVRLLLGR